MSDLWDALTNIADALAIVSFVAWAAGAVLLWRKQREYRQRVERLNQTPSRRPAALAVGLGGGIKGSVEAYLRDEGLSYYVHEIERDGILSLEEFDPVLAEVRAIKAVLTDAGATELHLFYKGPLSIAAGIGAIVDNWIPTIVYNFDHTTQRYRREVSIDRDLTIGAPKPKKP